MNEAHDLTLEAGKYYRTRAGRKAYISGINPFPDGSHIRAIGVIVDSGVKGWNMCGAYSLSSDHAFDLVAEWFEPKRIKRAINFYRDGSLVSHPDRASADSGARDLDSGKFDPDRIACIEIDVEEGHGLGEGN